MNLIPSIERDLRLYVCVAKYQRPGNGHAIKQRLSAA